MEWGAFDPISEGQVGREDLEMKRGRGPSKWREQHEQRH